MVKRGNKLYYPLGQKDAGLFFFPGKRDAPFAGICPGDGFSYVSSIHEGFPLARALSEKRYNAFESNTVWTTERRVPSRTSLPEYVTRISDKLTEFFGNKL